MSEKIRRVIIFFIVYGLIFLIGFKTGITYLRMKTKIEVEKVLIKDEEVAGPKVYYIVEKYNYGSHSHVFFYEQNDNDVIMKFFYNEKLKPLLKMRDIKIYTKEGEEIY